MQRISLIRLAMDASRARSVPMFATARPYATYPSSGSPNDEPSGESSDPTQGKHKDKNTGRKPMEQAMQEEEHPTGNPGDSPSVPGASQGKPEVAADRRSDEVEGGEGHKKK